MKASLCHRYGSSDVLSVESVDKPKPKKNELLIRICASAVTAADGMMREGKPLIGRLFLGLKSPKYPITGTGFSGVIEGIGEGVNDFKIGQSVFGESVFGAGSNAEYMCVPESALVMLKPDFISHQEAAPLCDGALTSMNFLQALANIQPNQRILINGAAGSLGCAAIQLSRYFGAHVTAVCSTKNTEFVTSLGAQNVIDYTKQNFTKLADNQESYDIIYDCVGNRTYSECQSVLTTNGIYMSPVLSLGLLLKMLSTSVKGKKKALFSATGTLPMNELKTLLLHVVKIINEKKLTTIIDKEYALSEISDAHQYVATGHKKGNIVVSMNTPL